MAGSTFDAKMVNEKPGVLFRRCKEVKVLWCFGAS